MNNQRRKEIKAAIKMVDDLRDQMELIKEAIDAIRSDEEEYRDGMPENLQQSERYYAADAAYDQLSTAYDEFDNFDLDTITTALEEAQA